MTEQKIFVDMWKKRKPDPKCSHDTQAHLFTTPGNESALHDFALKVLGLEKKWFHDKIGFPHYDITKEEREKAIKAGVSLFSWDDYDFARTRKIITLDMLNEMSKNMPPDSIIYLKTEKGYIMARSIVFHEDRKAIVIMG